MKIKVGISLRHVHLTEEDYKKLFKEDLKIKKAINQPGQFAAEQTIKLEKNGKVMDNVRVIGPNRDYTQVELSRTDAYFCKIKPPVRRSGQLEDSEEITIIGPEGKITKKACIIADRHIHITPKERKKYNLTKDVYKIKASGEKGGILYNVYIREAENSYFEVHLDSDDANAFSIKQNDEVEIID